MITFICCLIILIAGYFIYGKFIERIFGIDPARKTPAYTLQDGVDYLPMPSWKAFMIQFLNIAGLGPIFGAIMGAKFGTASFLWIVLGSIFAGAVHDYLAGMLSLRHNGMGENNAAVVVDSITKEWLGTVGSVLAILGVIAAPITSGDTAFRSARLIVADFLHMEQRSIPKRLLICIPLFLIAIALLLYSLNDKEGFEMIWRYFAWCNQTLAVFTLWALTVYLVRSKKIYIITLIPALFMTAVCSTYIFIAPEGLNMDAGISQIIGCCITVFTFILFIIWKRKLSKLTEVKE